MKDGTDFKTSTDFRNTKNVGERSFVLSRIFEMWYLFISHPIPRPKLAILRDRYYYLHFINKNRYLRILRKTVHVSLVFFSVHFMRPTHSTLWQDLCSRNPLMNSLVLRRSLQGQSSRDNPWIFVLLTLETEKQKTVIEGYTPK